ALAIKDGELPRYSGVWRKGDAGPLLTWNFDQASYEGNWPAALHVDVSVVRRTDLAQWAAQELGLWASGLGGLPWAGLYLRATRPLEPGWDRRYTDVWQDSGTHEAHKVTGLDTAAHLARCRQLAAEGWRPAALSVTTGEPGALATGVPDLA